MDPGVARDWDNFIKSVQTVPPPVFFISHVVAAVEVAMHSTPALPLQVREVVRVVVDVPVNFTPTVEAVLVVALAKAIVVNVLLFITVMFWPDHLTVANVLPAPVKVLLVAVKLETSIVEVPGVTVVVVVTVHTEPVEVTFHIPVPNLAVVLAAKEIAEAVTS